MQQALALAYVESAEKVSDDEESSNAICILSDTLTHALTFSGDFLSHDDPALIGPSERPISLYQAIVSIEHETWRDLARHVFRVAPDRLTADAVFRAAVETDACGSLISPVDVWIDPEGYYTVLVHDAATEG